MTEPKLTRRYAITGAAGAGLTLPLLAACGSGGSSGSGQGGASTTETTPGHRGGGGGSSGTALAKTADIKVGGGEIFTSQNVVVTQPSPGQFKAFSATCTHMGCQVAAIQDGVIVCPCHGSGFSIATGAVEGGPAPAPLPPVKISVVGGQITLDS